MVVVVDGVDVYGYSEGDSLPGIKTMRVSAAACTTYTPDLGPNPEGGPPIDIHGEKG